MIKSTFGHNKKSLRVVDLLRDRITGLNQTVKSSFGESLNSINNFYLFNSGRSAGKDGAGARTVR
jgi:hypothetical protein